MKVMSKRPWNCYIPSKESKMQNAFAFSWRQQERLHTSHSRAHNAQRHPREGKPISLPKSRQLCSWGRGGVFFLWKCRSLSSMAQNKERQRKRCWLKKPRCIWHLHDFNQYFPFPCAIPSTTGMPMVMTPGNALHNIGDTPTGSLPKHELHSPFFHENMLGTKSDTQQRDIKKLFENIKGSSKRPWNCYLHSTDSKLQNALAFS